MKGKIGSLSFANSYCTFWQYSTTRRDDDKATPAELTVTKNSQTTILTKFLTGKSSTLNPGSDDTILDIHPAAWSRGTPVMKCFYVALLTIWHSITNNPTRTRVKEDWLTWTFANEKGGRSQTERQGKEKVCRFSPCSQVTNDLRWFDFCFVFLTFTFTLKVFKFNTKFQSMMSKFQSHMSTFPNGAMVHSNNTHTPIQN